MQLFDDQHEPLEALKQVYLQHIDQSTLTAVTSFGKTTVSIAFVIWLLENTDARIWITVNKQSLVMQWWETAKLWNAQNHVGIIWAECPEFDTDDVTPLPRNELGRRVQICTLQTIGTKRHSRTFTARMPSQHLPTIVISDEIHETYNFAALAELFTLAQPLRIGLTGTPTSHKNARVSFASKWPQDRWIATKPAASMIEDGRWCPPEYKLPSEQLQQYIAERFSGMHLQPNGEYPTTRQRDVFMDCHQQIIAEWMLAGYANESTGFVCSDVTSAKTVHAYLCDLGVRAELFIGSTKNKNALLDKFRSGEVPCLVTVGCFITGVDVPRASCCVIMKLFGNIAQYHQLIGRFVRRHASKTRALIFDPAGNFGLYDTPEAIMDWRDFDASTPRHFDANSEVCACCGHQHKGLPRPILTRDPNQTFYTSRGMWETGDVMPYQHPLTCHGCGVGVHYDGEELGAYAAWLTESRSAFAKGTVPAPYEGGKGIYIGLDGSDAALPRLSGGMLYDFGLWRLTGEAEATTEMVDRSEEFIERMRECSQVLDALELSKVKIKYLAFEDQMLLKASSFSKLAVRGKGLPAVQVLAEYLKLSYLHGIRQKALTKAKACRIQYGLSSAEVADAAASAINNLAICPVSDELVANWIAQLAMDNVSSEKTVKMLCDALYTALVDHNPKTAKTFTDRAANLINSSTSIGSFAIIKTPA
jgi:superfamily II DNA or RNA helicase